MYKLTSLLLHDNSHNECSDDDNGDAPVTKIDYWSTDYTIWLAKVYIPLEITLKINTF